MVVFIILFGTRPIVRRGEGESRHYCPQCGGWRSFRRVTLQQWFTLFFIPVFPISRSRAGYECLACGLQAPEEALGPAREPETEAPARPSQAMNYGETLVVQCPRCDGRMRVPLREKGYKAICPHCTMEFRIKGQREEVPEAKIEEN